MIPKTDRKLWTPPRGVVMSRPWWRQRGFFVPMPFHKRYEVDAADFDGTNDNMTWGAGLIGAADSKQGIFSVWVRLDGSDGNRVRLFGNTTTVGGFTQRMSVARTNLGFFEVQCFDPSGNVALNMRTMNTYVAGSAWYNFLASWDCAVVGARHLYINDISDVTVSSFVDLTIDYTVADWFVAFYSGVGGSRFSGCMAEMYFAPGQYLDFSVEANRRKFILASGRPAPLGVNGALPTGTAALVYQRLRNNEAAANFATNRGTGGNFTITGSLDTASSSPSD